MAAVLKLVKICAPFSCLINMEPLELLRLHPSELIASESALDLSERISMVYIVVFLIGTVLISMAYIVVQQNNTLGFEGNCKMEVNFLRFMGVTE